MIVSLKNETPKTKDELLEEEFKSGKAIPVLDKGYVRLINSYGTDLDVVNAARASFAKESEILSEKDERLIAFLAREGHWAVFRHCFVTLEVKAPLEIARQWWKYATGSAQTDGFSTAWSEMSKRYVTSGLEFYIPEADQWRSAPENMKQGSAEPLDPETGAGLTTNLLRLLDETQAAYHHALALGVAPEVARLFLMGYGMYVSWRWSTSLQGLAFFLNQRLDEGAQSEIQEYASGVLTLTKDKWPVSMEALVNDGLE